MFLRKNPISPARLEANRRNSRKSTGPRTLRGKYQSRLNSPRSGGRLGLYRGLLLALANAPTYSVAQTARSVLTSAQAAHPWAGSWRGGLRYENEGTNRECL
jgi:hypothetical protein